MSKRIVSEKEKIPILESKIQSLTDRLTEEIKKTNDCMTKNVELSIQKDDLNNWKTIYESGNSSVIAAV